MNPFTCFQHMIQVNYILYWNSVNQIRSFGGNVKVSATKSATYIWCFDFRQIIVHSFLVHWFCRISKTSIDNNKVKIKDIRAMKMDFVLSLSFEQLISNGFVSIPWVITWTIYFYDAYIWFYFQYNMKDLTLSYSKNHKAIFARM